MLPFFLLLLDSGSLPSLHDLKNWQSVAVNNGSEQSCSFSLSPNFYGVVVRHAPLRDDFEISIDSPGVHVLPTSPAIPLKISINGEVQRTSGQRIDQKLFFHVSRPIVDMGMARKGTMQIILSVPNLPDTLIARYRLQGSGYLTSFARFQTCSRMPRTQPGQPTRTLAFR